MKGEEAAFCAARIIDKSENSSKRTSRNGALAVTHGTKRGRAGARGRDAASYAVGFWYTKMTAAWPKIRTGVKRS